MRKINGEYATTSAIMEPAEIHLANLSLHLVNHAVSALAEPLAKGGCAQKRNVTMKPQKKRSLKIKNTKNTFYMQIISTNINRHRIY